MASSGRDSASPIVRSWIDQFYTLTGSELRWRAYAARRELAYQEVAAPSDLPGRSRAASQRLKWQVEHAALISSFRQLRNLFVDQVLPGIGVADSGLRAALQEADCVLDTFSSVLGALATSSDEDRGSRKRPGQPGDHRAEIDRCVSRSRKIVQRLSAVLAGNEPLTISQEAKPTAEPAHVPPRTRGSIGRPNASQHYLDELNKRYRAGRLRDTLPAQVQDLHEWSPARTTKTIENVVRKRFREYRELLDN